MEIYVLVLINDSTQMQWLIKAYKNKNEADEMANELDAEFKCQGYSHKVETLFLG